MKKGRGGGIKDGTQRVNKRLVSALPSLMSCAGTFTEYCFGEICLALGHKAEAFLDDTQNKKTSFITNGRRNNRDLDVFKMSTAEIVPGGVYDQGTKTMQKTVSAGGEP